MLHVLGTVIDPVTILCVGRGTSITALHLSFPPRQCWFGRPASRQDLMRTSRGVCVGVRIWRQCRPTGTLLCLWKAGLLLPPASRQVDGLMALRDELQIQRISDRSDDPVRHTWADGWGRQELQRLLLSRIAEASESFHRLHWGALLPVCEQRVHRM